MWEWYCDISHVRTGNGYGPNPIGYAEIDAWARLMRTRPTPWEIALLRRVDAAVMRRMTSDKGDDEQVNEVSIDDRRGVSSILSRLRARANAVYG